ncbi:MAG: T9SS type A sorting domain-containing protein, partial [Chloroflexi bacterium]|nr:T9SS type A sorting domain-containing protein [Chloroflexota bacterium]
ITAGAGVDPSVGVRVTALGVLLDDQPLVDLRSVAYKGQCSVPLPEVGQVPDLDCDGTPDDPGDHALVTAHYKHKCPSRGQEEDVAPPDGVAGHFSASRAFPNPSSATVAVSYELPQETDVEVCIYGPTGQLVSVVERAHRKAGSHIARWDGLNEQGERVGSGVYFVRVSTPEEDVLRKVVVLK